MVFLSPVFCPQWDVSKVSISDNTVLATDTALLNTNYLTTQGSAVK